MAYQRSEQETSLLFEAETGEWRIYSTVPKHIRKLSSITNVEVLELDQDGQTPMAIRGTLKEKQVSMRQLRVLTEEQRERASARMASMHEKR